MTTNKYCDFCDHCDRSVNYAKIGVGDSPIHRCCKHNDQVKWCHSCEDWEERK